MSVHGYPADMSIFCNLQLGLLKLQEDTPQADIDQDNVSLAGVMQGAVGRSLIPRARHPCSRVPLLGDNMRFSETSGTQSGRVWTPFSQSFSVSWTQILQCSWNWLLCSMLVMFLRARCWLVGAFAVHIQPATWNELRESQTLADVTLYDIRLADETLWLCVCHSLLYGLHLQRAPK